MLSFMLCVLEEHLLTMRTGMGAAQYWIKLIVESFGNEDERFPKFQTNVIRVEGSEGHEKRQSINQLLIYLSWIAAQLD